MMMDVNQAAKAMRDDKMLAEIEHFLEGFYQPTGQWGPGGNVVERARAGAGFRYSLAGAVA
jgi:hypothetical protein